MKIIFIFLFSLIPLMVEASALPRKVIGFWDSRLDKRSDASLTHLTVEFPLNHLGLDVEYYDIHGNLPDLSSRNDILGVLLCFRETTKINDPLHFIDWLINASDLGKKIVILKNPGFLADTKKNYTPLDNQNHLFEKIGFTMEEQFIGHTFEYQITLKENSLFPFEKPLPTPLPPFQKVKGHSKETTSFLKISSKHNPEEFSDLILVGKKGAYVSEFFANNYDPSVASNTPSLLGWYFDPFRFFTLAFELQDLPIPDTTTVSGRRIYHATCHGDGWNMISELTEHKNQYVSCAKVILDEILVPFPDMPSAVSIVAADVDPHWAAEEESQAFVKEVFDLPQVLPASHTYSHPFDWQFFKGDGKKEEVNYLHLYPYGTWRNSYISWVEAQYNSLKNFKKKPRLKDGYVTPRAFATEPFSIDLETVKSLEYLEQFTDDKPVNLIIWSGDSLVWDEILAYCKEKEIQQFGGGTCRYDQIYSSLLFIPPLARKPGGFIQMLNSANGDNNYTGEWKRNFYGFRYVMNTWKRLETPRRLKPILLYYHHYSGQFDESLQALKTVIRFARKQHIIPLFTTQVCDIGEGFYKTKFTPLEDNVWKVENRGALQTIRFEEAKNTYVDYKKCQGVLGHTHHGKSLYLHLDKENASPIIATSSSLSEPPFYLIDSRWEFWDHKQEDNAHHYMCQGWGSLDAKFYMPDPLKMVTLTVDGTLIKRRFFSRDNILHINLPLPYGRPVSLHIEIE